MSSNNAIKHPDGEPMIAGEDYYLGQRITYPPLDLLPWQQDWLRKFLDDARVITGDHYANQPIPCLAGGGQSCGIWVYCDRPHGHDGAHEGWSATTERCRAERVIWTDAHEHVQPPPHPKDDQHPGEWI